MNAFDEVTREGTREASLKVQVQLNEVTSRHLHEIGLNTLVEREKREKEETTRLPVAAQEGGDRRVWVCSFVIEIGLPYRSRIHTDKGRELRNRKERRWTENQNGSTGTRRAVDLWSCRSLSSITIPVRKEKRRAK